MGRLHVIGGSVIACPYPRPSPSWLRLALASPLDPSISAIGILPRLRSRTPWLASSRREPLPWPASRRGPPPLSASAPPVPCRQRWSSSRSTSPRSPRHLHPEGEARANPPRCRHRGGCGAWRTPSTGCSCGGRRPSGSPSSRGHPTGCRRCRGRSGWLTSSGRPYTPRVVPRR
jgi:hypothetical protein